MFADIEMAHKIPPNPTQGGTDHEDEKENKSFALLHKF
jgi:hypothetical protein